MKECLIQYRKRRGWEIFERFKIVSNGNGHDVPSEAKLKKKYHVVVTSTDVSCTCLDHAQTGERCKHIYAVEFLLRGDEGLEQSDAPVGPRRPTYTRDWPAINKAQTREEDEFEPMLSALLESVAEPPHERGRCPVPRHDALFGLISKVYIGKSARRSMPRLNLAYRRGYLEKPITFGTISAYMERPEITPILEDLIVRSSLPMASLETRFAADSTGMSGSRFINWRSIKYRGIIEKMWAKLHVMIGVKTLIVTAAYIGDRDASDPVQLPKLLGITTRNFTIREVYADKAYNTKGFSLCVR